MGEKPIKIITEGRFRVDKFERSYNLGFYGAKGYQKLVGIRKSDMLLLRYFLNKLKFKKIK